jgi:nucleotide-binding universal stress UspA family protein
MTILAVIDDIVRSKRAVRIGYDLATRYDDTLTVLHVIPREDYEEHKENLEGIAEFSDFTLDQEQGSAEQFAREFAIEAIEDVDMDRIEPLGRVGDTAEEVLREADRIDPRYLVISGRRRSRVGKALFGDTAQEILLNANCPVVTSLNEE